MTDPMIARDTVAGTLARWEAERRRERTEAAVAARALRAALLPLARAAGATVIRAAYEGGGAMLADIGAPSTRRWPSRRRPTLR